MLNKSTLLKVVATFLLLSLTSSAYAWARPVIASSPR